MESSRHAGTWVWSGVRGEGRAGAEDVAVSVSTVDATHRWPVLGAAVDAARVRRELATIRMRPLVGHHVGRGVGRVVERVVVAGPFARADAVDLDADRD